jgi:hypothetical protein
VDPHCNGGLRLRRLSQFGHRNLCTAALWVACLNNLGCSSSRNPLSITWPMWHRMAAIKRGPTKLTAKERREAARKSPSRPKVKQGAYTVFSTIRRSSSSDRTLYRQPHTSQVPTPRSCGRECFAPFLSTRCDKIAKPVHRGVRQGTPH